MGVVGGVNCCNSARQANTLLELDAGQGPNAGLLNLKVATPDRGGISKGVELLLDYDGFDVTLPKAKALAVAVVPGISQQHRPPEP